MVAVMGYTWLWFKMACDDEAEVEVADITLAGDNGHVKIYGGVLRAVGHNSIGVNGICVGEQSL